MIKLLWVDDNLDQDLTEKRMYLLMQDDIQSDFASDATEAYYHLINDKYDVVVFDLRHPAGIDDMWDEDFKNGEQKFGLLLLRKVKNNENGKFGHLTNTQFGVFTIEPPEKNELLFKPPFNLQKDHYMIKTQADEIDFVNFIHRLYQSKKN